MTRRPGGWRHLHPDAVIVARPSRWGNPISVAHVEWYVPRLPASQRQDYAARAFRDLLGTAGENVGQPPRMSWTSPVVPGSRQLRVEQFTYPTLTEIRAALAGRDLACWCPPGSPCHADVLLELATPGAVELSEVARG